MKIISWNINGYRAITGQNASKRLDTVTKDNKLFQFIAEENPDIICLQETKSSPEQIHESLLAPSGYKSYFSSSTVKKGYSGVCVITKETPKNVNYGIGINEFDDEGRIIQLDFDKFTLFNIYFPSGTSGMHRVDYKLEFYDALFAKIEELRKTQPNIIICGDYNTAHFEIDLARPKDNINNSGFMPIEREKLDWVVSLGYFDCFRKFSNEANQYTWWSQRGGARAKNIGWRIDYFFATNEMNSTITNSYIMPNQLGSDHCPIVLELDS